MDIQNRIGFINPAFTQLLGYRLQDIHLMNLTDFFLRSDQEKVRQADFVLEKGESVIQKIQFKQADNTFIWLEINHRDVIFVVLFVFDMFLICLCDFFYAILIIFQLNFD